MAALAPSLFPIASVQAVIAFLPGNLKHFSYIVIPLLPLDTYGSDLLLFWGLKETQLAPVIEAFTSFLCPQAVEIEDRRIQSCVHFMTLKKLNRLAHIRLKKGRDQTHEVIVEKFNLPSPSSSPSPFSSPLPTLSVCCCPALPHSDLPHSLLTLPSFQAKQKVDAYHLQLQNLLYEVMHLQKEITKCLEFK